MDTEYYNIDTVKAQFTPLDKTTLQQLYNEYIIQNNTYEFIPPFNLFEIIILLYQEYLSKTTYNKYLSYNLYSLLFSTIKFQKDENKNLRTELAHINSNIITILNYLKSNLFEIEILNQKNKSLENEIKELNIKLNTNTINMQNEHKLILDKKNTEIKVLTDTIEKNKDNIRILERNCVILEQNINEQYKSYCHDINILRKELLKFEEEINTLNKIIEDYSNKCVNYVCEINTLNKAIIHLENISSIKEQNLLHEINKLNIEINSLKLLANDDIKNIAMTKAITILKQ